MFKVKDGVRVGAIDVIGPNGNILTTAANALLFDSKSPSFYTNATNLSSGTLDVVRLPSQAYTTLNLSFGNGLSLANGVLTANVGTTGIAFLNRYPISTNGVASSFTMAYAVTRPEDIVVSLNGIRLDPANEYTVSGTSLTVSQSLVAGDIVIAERLGGGQGLGIPKGGNPTQILVKTSSDDYAAAWQDAAPLTTTLTGDVTGSGSGTVPTILATVNANVGTFGSIAAIPTLTVDGKGRITAISTSPLSFGTGLNVANGVVTLASASTAFLSRFVVSNTTVFAMAQSATSVNDIIVTQNGQRLDPTLDYTVSGTTLNVSTAQSGDIIIAERNGGSTGPAASTPPQITYLTSGSGTYTVPTGCLYLEIEMRGGGSGGSGSGGFDSSGNALAPTPSSGAIGGDTTFGSLKAGGGQAPAGRVGATGGTSTGGDINRTGASGGTQRDYYTGQPAGNGGGEGGGWSIAATAGPDALQNSGAGGAGAGTNYNYREGGGGGSQGGYLTKILANPSASYSYAIGAGGIGGTAGSNGFAGGAGAKGWIKITARFA